MMNVVEFNILLPHKVINRHLYTKKIFLIKYSGEIERRSKFFLNKVVLNILLTDTHTFDVHCAPAA